MQIAAATATLVRLHVRGSGWTAFQATDDVELCQIEVNSRMAACGLDQAFSSRRTLRAS